MWYSFEARSTNPTVSFFGTPTLGNARIQVFFDPGGSPVSFGCSASAGAAVVTSGLVVGQIYHIRIYSGTAANTGAFRICVTDPAPANDGCTGTLLNSAPTCVPGGSQFTGTMQAATLSTVTISGVNCELNPVAHDVWYRFVAESPNPTISLPTVGTGLAGNVRIQLLTNCTGTVTSLGCGTTSITASGLTLGTTYYVRVYTTGASSTANGLDLNFDICVTDPAPTNDLCGSTTTLISNPTCVNVQGFLTTATTYTTIPTLGCGTANNDVWYSFEAKSTNPSILLSAAPTNSRIQLFSGTCGSLASITCQNSTINATGLTIGDIYLVRVYSTTNATGTFNICVTDPVPTNDNCAPVLLNSEPGCTLGGSMRTGTMQSATATGGLTIASDCEPSPIAHDVWYSFVAESPNPTISLPTVGAGFGGILRMQLLTGCTGSVTALGCGNNSSPINASGLTLGTTYYVRVYQVGAPATANGFDLNFNVCVTDPSPNNDGWCNAVSLTSAPTCNVTWGTLSTSTYTVLSDLDCGGTGDYNDVWYSFVAKSTNPRLTLNTSMTGATTNGRIQLYTAGGVCPSLTLTAYASACGASPLNTTGLTIGATYYVRVFSNTNASGIFTVCVQDIAPANDACIGSSLLTSSTTCNLVRGNFQASALSAVTINGSCEAGTPVYDVWYRFVAQTPNPTVTFVPGPGLGPDVRIQLLTGCSGSVNSLFCGTTSMATDYLSIGATYYVRVYSLTGTAPADGADLTFDICVTDPVTPPPFNDECTNATTLPVSIVCDNVGGTVASATPSTGAPTPTCGTPTYDVWYRFTAVSTLTNITLSGGANNFTNRFVQLLSGDCGTLTEMGCGASITGAATSPGTTYYVRVFSTTAGAAPNGNANFNICARGTTAPPRIGNSYVNITKKTTGGVVQPGDTLEIRMTINHKSTAGTLYNPRFLDNIPTGTNMATGLLDSIYLITNEGLKYKAYSLSATDDAAAYVASPSAGNYNVRMNVLLNNAGIGASGIPTADNSTEATSADNAIITDTARPRGGGGVLFATAYRVIVTAPVGGLVQINAPVFIYRSSTGGTDITLTGTPFQILVKDPETLCANSTGLNNAMENGGTFGSGSTLTRATDLTTPIPGYRFIPNFSPSVAIGDGTYTIVKNMSPRNGTNRTARRIPNCNTIPLLSPNDPLSCENRMFGGHADVDGDHTGTNDAAGNVPPTQAANGGYMLMMNADFVASEAYRQTINNLCPNTYYEFSAWVRNVCPTCGADSLGRQFNTAMPDEIEAGYPGVLPNLSFAVDGIDHYSTGEVSPLTGWEKRGFVFRTTPTQTSATFTVRNNSQGGGGNDWAMDDISVATCLPNMRYSPRTADSLCMNNLYVIGDTVRSIYDNYTHYRWQRRRSGESTWTDLTGDLDATVGGGPTAIPLNYETSSGQYMFVTTWTLPPSETQYANNSDLYRVIVSTTDINLGNPACRYSDSSGIFHLRVMDCMDALDVNLLSFKGNLRQSKPVIEWTTSKETEPVNFRLEKSNDGLAFRSIAALRGYNNASETNRYAYTDSVLKGKAYYRLSMIHASGKKVKSKVVLLQAGASVFALQNLVNPFTAELSFDVALSENGTLRIALLDGTGRSVRSQTVNGYAGSNEVKLADLQALARGVYVLQVGYNGQTVSQKVVKQ